ncbi:hypothetical protein FH972_021680 [Carpinus fangiana]|uniref:Uncharacterized protein n=1 Tax=Carpinus fangiana TaxID=176857 RepID=A0A5N6KQ20_9ROSI|nr:hypothetical protein FH972_021680 [Carpinus fangiana]
MSPQAAGSRKSRASVTKVVPAIPHALAARPKTRSESATSPATSSSPSNPAAPSTATEGEGGAAVLQAIDSNAASEPQQPATNGEVTPSATTSEESIATSTSQSTPPASTSYAARNVDADGGKEDRFIGPDINDTSFPSDTPGVRDLPPAFYPTSQQSNPSPATSNSAHRPPPPIVHGVHHRNSSNLVFGGRQDSVSPSPGLNILPGAPFAGAPLQPFPNHSPSSPAYPPNGHSYHVSEPFAGPMYPPPYMHNNSNAGYAREMYHAPYPQPRPFPPATRGPPGRRDFGPSHGLPPPRPIPTAASHMNGPPGLQGSEASPGEALALCRYLRGQFGNREHADYVVVISHSGHKLSPGTFALHGIMLARSPKLASLMNMNQSGPAAFPRTVHLVISDRFIDLDEVVTKGLMHLYGEPLLEAAMIPDVLAASGFPPNPYLQLRAALAYAALGHYLQLDAIVIRGLHLAASLLNWQNIGLGLSFALEGGLGASWSEQVHDKTSATLMDESGSPASAPVYGIYSDRMLYTVIQFIITHFPLDFDLAASVPQLPEAPRLPTAAEPRHARTGSRLSQIRFGEMTMEDRGPEIATLSGVLLSLPFAILKHVLEHPSLVARLGADKVAEAMRSTVEEREQRRQRIAGQSGEAGPAAGPDSSLDERLWNSIRWVEAVEAAGEQRAGFSGVQLTRRCVQGGAGGKAAGQGAS